MTPLATLQPFSTIVRSCQRWLHDNLARRPRHVTYNPIRRPIPHSEAGPNIMIRKVIIRQACLLLVPPRGSLRVEINGVVQCNKAFCTWPWQRYVFVGESWRSWQAICRAAQEACSRPQFRQNSIRQTVWRLAQIQAQAPRQVQLSLLTLAIGYK